MDLKREIRTQRRIVMNEGLLSESLGNKDEYDENKISSHTEKLKKIKAIKSRKLMCSVCCFFVTSYLLTSGYE